MLPETSGMDNNAAIARRMMTRISNLLKDEPE
jgi:hypothetical protein